MAYQETSFVSITFSLFLLMDSIGNVPIYLALLKELPPKRQRLIVLRELLIAFAVIVLFSFVGEYLLDLLGIDARTVLIAGGLILFLIAIKMIFPSAKNSYTSGTDEGEPFIVPLAIPLVAGPSVLAAVMIYSHTEAMTTLIGAISIAWVFTAIVLMAAPFLKKILGAKGVSACERLMGLLLTLMAVQMFLEGISAPAV